MFASHPIHFITSKSETHQIKFWNSCLYYCINCEEDLAIMPCSPLCRNHLALVQNRYVCNWIISTITMMENSAGLFQFTQELPWTGFELSTVNHLIRQFSEFHVSIHDRIQRLVRTTTSGCRLCRRQQQARKSQN